MRRSERLAKKRNLQQTVDISDGQLHSLEDTPHDNTGQSYLNISAQSAEYHKLNLKNSPMVKKQSVDWTEWIAATDTKNYMMDDGFLDLLSQKSSAVIAKNPEYAAEIGNMISLSSDQKGFVPSLLNAGNSFEVRVIGLLTQNLGQNNVRNIGGNHQARSLLKYQETLTAMHDGIPCIFQGVLRNEKNKTYGIPDILIRSDWINRITDCNSLSKEEEKVSAPNLRNPQRNSTRVKRGRKNKSVKPSYHYVVIDIKYKTMPLRSDGYRLRNDGNMKAYKAQLCVYNQALGEFQGYLPGYAFILGSKWKYTHCGQNFESDSCLERLGRIDYDDLDSNYIGLTEKAISWLRTVVRDGQNWDLSKYPLPRAELYPNMCNRHDYPYSGIKRMFAEQNNDLTLLWNVGPKQRRNAIANGVYSWTDPKCTPEVLGMGGKVRPKVLSRILEANHSTTNTIIPKNIEKNIYDWASEKVELFVDFETTCSVFSDQESLPIQSGTSLIFLIGAGYIDPKTKKWVYRKFLADNLTTSEETRICREFTQWIQKIEKQFNEVIRLWHWSHAEPAFWKRACGRQPQKKRRISKKIIQQLGLTQIPTDLEWCDLLKIFLHEPIGVKGCLNYGLKNIAKTFHQHGFIETIWDDTSATSNGADVAVEAYRADEECKKTGTLFSDHPLAEDIVRYNEVDCKVLQEILYYLRENHPPLKKDVYDLSEDDDLSWSEE